MPYKHLKKDFPESKIEEHLHEAKKKNHELDKHLEKIGIGNEEDIEL